MTDSRSLPDIPNKKNATNWVEKAGGLPSYIERVARHLRSEKGYTTSRAIATAVNHSKKMCATGTAFGGETTVSPKARAVACNAVKAWEALKAKSKVSEAFVGEINRVRFELASGLERDELAGLEGPARRRLANAQCVNLDCLEGAMTRQFALALVEARDPETAELRAAVEEAIAVDRTLLEVLAPQTRIEEAIATFDPRLHPRDRVGKFREVLNALAAGDMVRLPDATTIAKLTPRSFEVEGDSGTAELNNPSAAARVALDMSAQSEHPDSLGGLRTYKNAKGYEKVERRVVDAFKKNKKTEAQAAGEIGIEALGVAAGVLLAAAVRDEDLGPETLEEITSERAADSSARRAGANAAAKGAAGGARRAAKGRDGQAPGKPKKPKDPNDRGFEDQHPRGRGGKWVAKGDGMGDDPDKKVRQLQQRLVDAGYKLTVDGRFGPETEEAVEKFQADHGLREDGQVGPKTTHALRHPEAGKVDKDEGEGDGDRDEDAISEKELKKELGVEDKKSKKKKSSRSGGGGSGKGEGASDGGAGGRSGEKSEGRGGSGGASKEEARSVVERGDLKQGLGMTGKPSPVVKALQTVLEWLGFDLGEAGVDGRFGPITERAVKAFQKDNDLEPNGKVDKRMLRRIKRLARDDGEKGEGQKKRSYIDEALRVLPTQADARRVILPGVDDPDRDPELRLREAVGLRMRAHEAGDVTAFTVARARENAIRTELREGLGSGLKIAWDDAQHPRGRGGKFAKVIGGLKEGETVKIKGSGVKVKKTKEGFEVKSKKGVEKFGTADAAAGKGETQHKMSMRSKAVVKEVAADVATHAVAGIGGAAVDDSTAFLLDMISITQHETQAVRVRPGSFQRVSRSSTRIERTTIGVNRSSAHRAGGPSNEPVQGAVTGAGPGVGKTPRSPLLGDNPLLDMLEAAEAKKGDGGFSFDPADEAETMAALEDMAEGATLKFATGVQVGWTEDGWMISPSRTATTAVLFPEEEARDDVARIATSLHDRLSRKAPAAAEEEEVEEAMPTNLSESFLERFHPRDRKGRFRDAMNALSAMKPGETKTIEGVRVTRKNTLDPGREDFAVAKKRGKGDINKDHVAGVKNTAALVTSLSRGGKDKRKNEDKKREARAQIDLELGDKVQIIGKFGARPGDTSKRAYEASPGEEKTPPYGEVIGFEPDRYGGWWIKVKLPGGRGTMTVSKGDVQRFTPTKKGGRRLAAASLSNALGWELSEGGKPWEKGGGDSKDKMQGGGAMKRCSSCGWKNPLGSTVCKKCKAKLRASGDPKDKRKVSEAAGTSHRATAVEEPSRSHDLASTLGWP